MADDLAREAIRAAWSKAVDRLAKGPEQLQTLEKAIRDVEAGKLDPAHLNNSARWRDPMTGEKWRVAGQRGNKHWIPSGPTRERWWR